jgi:hypothetical protein
VTPPIVAVFSMLLLAAGALEAGAAALEVPELVELVELPQAVIISAASPAGASHLLFIPCPRSDERTVT